MARFPETPTEFQLVTLAQFAATGNWRLALAHDAAHAMLIWVTRGQGLALLDGTRRGVGVHNAVFVPARDLFALDLGRQAFGLALIVPESAGTVLPRQIRHLRIRDSVAQTELTALLDALSREQHNNLPLAQGAMAAYSELIAIWLRRQIFSEEHEDPADTSGRKLIRAYGRLLAEHYASGMNMTGYARLLGVTPTHLSRVCKAETGRTAAHLLNERILHRAHELLIFSDAPIGNIATHLGFGSAAYFTRFIGQHTGKSPTALRRLEDG